MFIKISKKINNLFIKERLKLTFLTILFLKKKENPIFNSDKYILTSEYLFIKEDIRVIEINLPLYHSLILKFSHSLLSIFFKNNLEAFNHVFFPLLDNRLFLKDNHKSSFKKVSKI